MRTHPRAAEGPDKECPLLTDTAIVWPDSWCPPRSLHLRRFASTMAMLLARMRPAATGVMRRSFSTAPATMSESAVAAKAGAGEIAPLAVPMSYGLGELAIMPMTMAANNMALGMSLARWGVAGGLFLYMLIRPKEWSQVRSLDVTVSRFCAARTRGRMARTSWGTRAPLPRSLSPSCGLLTGSTSTRAMVVCCRMTSGPADSRTCRSRTNTTRCVTERLFGHFGQLGPAVIGR